MSSKQQVIAALMTLRAGRSPANGNRAIRRILSQFGATTINDLREEYYAAAIAAVTIPSAADFYGVTTDIQPIVPLITVDVERTAKPSRTRSPLTLALEAELARVRAKTKRSVPSGRTNIGAPSVFGDQDDSAPQPSYPQGMEKKS